MLGGEMTAEAVATVTSRSANEDIAVTRACVNTSEARNARLVRLALWGSEFMRFALTITSARPDPILLR